MNRFRNILLLADEGDRRGPGLLRAATLARANGARLTVVEVVEPLTPRLLLAAPSAQEAEVADRLQALDEAVAPFRAEGLDIETAAVVGKPFLELIRRVLYDGHDLVMKTARGGMGSLSLFGSTALHLMRKCPCPVWIVPPGAPERYRRILAAIGPGPDADGDESAELDRTILQLASSLAEREGAELHVVHAWQMIGEQTLAGPRFQTGEREIARMAAEVCNDREDWIERLLGDTGNPAAEIHLQKGDPTDIVVGTAARLPADLLVMGTVSRTGVAGLLIGNTAERVLSRVRTSVLSVKPSRFQSPVRIDPAPTETLGLG